MCFGVGDMSIIVPQEIFIAILEDCPPAVKAMAGMTNVTKEQARQNLIDYVGVDFGDDTVAWRKWFRENQPWLVNMFMPGQDEINIAILEERPSIILIGFRTTKEQAREYLIEFTGQDFGYDGEAWRQWYRENRSELAR